MKYRKKPLEVDAIHYNGDNFSEILEFYKSLVGPVDMDEYIVQEDDEIAIYTQKGWTPVAADEWIIRGINGEFYICTDDVFQKTYDSVGIDALMPDFIGKL